VALIGRPNTGKSTLFNRLIRKRRAIVDDLAGVTRDRLYGVTEWQGYEFNLIDCGGLGEESEDPLWQHVAENSRRALDEADAALFLVDARTGHITADDEVTKLLRRSRKPVVVAVNKVESVKQEATAYEFYSLGFKDLFLVSALTGNGVGEMLEALTAQLDWSKWPEATPPYFKWRYYHGERPETTAGRGPDAAEQARIAAAIAAHEAARAEWDEDGAEPETPGGPEAGAAAALEDNGGRPGAAEEDEDNDADWAEAELEDPDWDDEEDDQGAELADDTDLTEAEREEDYPFAFNDETRPLFVPDESWRELPIRLVLVGKQNAGKSSLTNALLGEERALVNPLPGTTRDPLYAEFVHGDTRFEILDTAGMKRISRISENVDYYSLLRAEKSLRYSQVALLIIDITQGVTEQDKRIASKIAEDAKAIVVIASKADLIEPPEGVDVKMAEQMYLQYLRRELDELKWAEVIFTSAVKQRGLDELCRAARRARDNYHRRIDNRALTTVMQEAITLNPPPIVKNRELRFFDFRQIGNCPPAILIEVNDKKLLRTSYKRFLHNTLRKHFDFTGTHVNLVWYTKTRGKK
jgi:ribosome-associated GTPase EngA